ncbi:MAG: RDD family protein [Nitrospirae bacterium]|nr:RDD family protein [Nitrospirota bacterium]
MSSPENLSEKAVPAKAGLLNRIIAKSIDLLIISAMIELLPVAGYFAGLVYLFIADGLIEGRSVGKWLIGLKVIIRDSDPPAPCGFKESILRNILFVAVYLIFGVFRFIPLIGWLFTAAAVAVIVVFESLIIVGSEDGMRFGDEIAKTQVVYEK